MFKINNPIIEEVFEKMNKKEETIIYGGYIRDSLLNEKPTDIDILTNLKKEEIISLFPYAQHRINNLGFEIFSFKRNNVEFDISLNENRNINEKTFQSDLTINGFTYSKKRGFFDPHNGLEDLKNKKIIQVKNYYNDTEKLKLIPQSLIRPFRFSSKFNFFIEEELIEALKNNHKIFFLIPENIRNLEGHKIIFSKNPARAIFYLKQTHILNENFNYEDIDNFIFKNMPHLQLSYLSMKFSKKIISEFMENFCFSNKIKNKVEETLFLLESDKKIENFKKMNEIILLRSKL